MCVQQLDVWRWHDGFVLLISNDRKLLILTTYVGRISDFKNINPCST